MFDYHYGLLASIWFFVCFNWIRRLNKSVPLFRLWWVQCVRDLQSDLHQHWRLLHLFLCGGLPVPARQPLLQSQERWAPSEKRHIRRNVTLLFMSQLFISSTSSTSRPASRPGDCQLPKHPSYLPERQHGPQSSVHQHQTNHSHGLHLRQGNDLLDPRRRLSLSNTPQMCLDPKPQELHGGTSHQHLLQSAPWVHPQPLYAVFSTKFITWKIWPSSSVRMDDRNVLQCFVCVFSFFFCNFTYKPCLYI